MPLPNAAITRRRFAGGLLAASFLPHVARAQAAPATILERGPQDRAEVALTFDCGADRGYTADILDTLAATGILASFGVTGAFADAYPDLVRRMVDEGHALINHSYDAPLLHRREHLRRRAHHRGTAGPAPAHRGRAGRRLWTRRQTALPTALWRRRRQRPGRPRYGRVHARGDVDARCHGLGGMVAAGDARPRRGEPRQRLHLPDARRRAIAGGADAPRVHRSLGRRGLRLCAHPGDDRAGERPGAGPAARPTCRCSIHRTSAPISASAPISSPSSRPGRSSPSSPARASWTATPGTTSIRLTAAAGSPPTSPSRRPIRQHPRVPASRQPGTPTERSPSVASD